MHGIPGMCSNASACDWCLVSRFDVVCECKVHAPCIKLLPYLFVVALPWWSVYVNFSCLQEKINLYSARLCDLPKACVQGVLGSSILSQCFVQCPQLRHL